MDVELKLFSYIKIICNDATTEVSPCKEVLSAINPTDDPIRIRYMPTRRVIGKERSMNRA